MATGVDAPTDHDLRGPLRNSDPASGAVSVSLSDTLDIWGITYNPKCRASRGIYVGVSGDIKMTMADGSVVTRKNVPVGEFPWRVKQLWNTGTTASQIIADY